MRIALLGAESTGKTTLAHAMAHALRGRGQCVSVVDEVLREWCAQQGRAPSPAEHATIACEQERRVDEAAASADVVITDTTALVVCLYGGLTFKDDATWRFALQRQRAYELTVVAGLDLPWVPDGLHRAGPTLRESFDAQMREALGQSGTSWRVVYGQGDERAQNALQAVAEVAPWAWPPPAERQARWKGLCDACSDPDCEHRLFTGLRRS
jgi:nicotinamide riboside kinase